MICEKERSHYLSTNYPFCRRGAYSFHADIEIIVKDIFAYISPKTGRIWIKLVGGLKVGKEWLCKFFGEIAPRALEKGTKTNFLCGIPRILLVTSALRISTKLGRNTWIRVRMNRFVAKFWKNSPKGSLSENNCWNPISVTSVNFWVNNSRTVRRRKTLTSLACPLSI